MKQTKSIIKKLKMGKMIKKTKMKNENICEQILYFLSRHTQKKHET
jgi:hypothetical protein